MFGTTDIPEWCTQEALGAPWRFGEGSGGGWPLSSTDVGRLYEASPISVVANVRCRALLVLGAADRRVPVANGRQWAAALRARGQPCEVHEYPDEGHALGGAEASAHVSVTIVQWICDQLLAGDEASA
jgi:dipeptidyl aminopeptidase/acylaminoacyl peptidase